MNKFFSLICLSAVATSLLLVVGCSSKKNEPSPVPVADFTFKTLVTIPPADVDFTNISKNATSYKWDFGDNTTSVIASPKHTYTKAGTYIVKLTATGPGGSSQAEDQIDIGAKKMIINALIIDSAVQVANPSYFYATIDIEQKTITMGDYYLPLSPTPYYPTGSWYNIKQSVSLQSDVVIKLFYKLPGGNTSYPVGGNGPNTFRFKPSELVRNNAIYPDLVAFANGSGATQNKISLTLSWE